MNVNTIGFESSLDYVENLNLMMLNYQCKFLQEIKNIVEISSLCVPGFPLVRVNGPEGGLPIIGRPLVRVNGPEGGLLMGNVAFHALHVGKANA